MSRADRALAEERFANGANTAIVANGTFVNSQYFPILGYQPGGELAGGLGEPFARLAEVAIGVVDEGRGPLDVAPALANLGLEMLPDIEPELQDCAWLGASIDTGVSGSKPNGMSLVASSKPASASTA